MRTVKVDLSIDGHKHQRVFGGYVGEHKETKLIVTLPSRLLSNDITYYYFDFQTPYNEHITSPNITKSNVTKNGEISIELWEQLLSSAGDLIFCVTAAVVSNGEVELKGKTASCMLQILPSPVGTDTTIDVKGTEDQLQKAINDALQEAKDSGEFKGDPGEPGAITNLDRHYTKGSSNAQAGTAVDEAIEEAGSFFSNALLNTVSGNILRLDDVSLAQKKLTGNISAVDDSVPSKAYVYDKNILNSTLWSTQIVSRGVTYEYLPDEECFLINGTTTGESSPTKTIGLYALNNKFTLSVKYVSGSITIETGKSANIFIQKSDTESGAAQIFATNALTNSDSVKVSAACDKNYLKAWGFYISSGVEFNNYKIKIQLEFGDAATTYKKFVEPIELTPDSSGNIEFNSKDNITLMLPSPGVINIKYCRDINKAFDELKQAIVSLGGNI